MAHGADTVYFPTISNCHDGVSHVVRLPQGYDLAKVAASKGIYCGVIEAANRKRTYVAGASLARFEGPGLFNLQVRGG